MFLLFFSGNLKYLFYLNLIIKKNRQIVIYKINSKIYILGSKKNS